jgi:hypothetical protein
VPQGSEPEINSSRFGFSGPDPPLRSNPSLAIDPALLAPQDTVPQSCDSQSAPKTKHIQVETRNCDGNSNAESESESNTDSDGNDGGNGDSDDDNVDDGNDDSGGESGHILSDADARRQFGIFFSWMMCW